MIKGLTTVIVSAGALAVAAWIFDGIRITGTDDTERAVTLVVVAAIFGAINAFIAPVIKLLSLPFIILTLGLALIVINACMLLLAAWIAEQVDLGFVVNGFWTAVGGAIVISLVSAVLNLVLDAD
ncbi:MAG: phage holin family protein [Actinomycetota bacterium]|nr:phage holin family protein [Actinomycetota bacterium]